METRSVANFEVALIKAYETLAKFQNETDPSTQRPRGPGCSRKGFDSLLYISSFG